MCVFAFFVAVCLCFLFTERFFDVRVALFCLTQVCVPAFVTQNMGGESTLGEDCVCAFAYAHRFSGFLMYV